jgi:hypothetical protein
VQDRYRAIAINKTKNSIDICSVEFRWSPSPRIVCTIQQTFYFSDGMNQLRDAKVRKKCTAF